MGGAGFMKGADYVELLTSAIVMDDLRQQLVSKTIDSKTVMGS